MKIPRERWSIVLIVWWSFVWRLVVVLVALAIPATLCIQTVVAPDKASALHNGAAALSSFVLQFPVSLWALREALRVFVGLRDA